MTQCPANSINYNQTLCACPPGYILDPATRRSCSLFNASSDIHTVSGVDYNTLSFPATIFDFDSIRRFTQSQAVFLEATAVMVLSWLLFCFCLRVFKLGDGRNVWFKIRWWISRLDICFATRHWLDDQRPVMKRKTELGGTFSIASWILFIGLFAALLYQIISKRTIEVHNIRAMNAPDLAAFLNDMEFNITTVSSMSCSNLRGLGNLVTGRSGFVDQRVVPLRNFVNYTCMNTTMGPTLSFKCTNCQIITDSLFISWQFVDIPGSPAAAVAFQFNLTANYHGDKKHVSAVGGTVKNGSTLNSQPVTFRGTDRNIIRFNLFPRIYHNLRDLKLIQPLFHDFLPGSFYTNPTQLQNSLQTSVDGLINTTLYINYLSSYVVEIENQNIMGPVSFLADLGGLYCISIGIFFYLMVQCEYRIKKLRNEDRTMRNIRKRLKAQARWEKLRKYVIYTWGCSALDDDLRNNNNGESSCSFMLPSVNRNGSLHGGGSSKKRSKRLDSINFNRNAALPSEKNTILELNPTQGVTSLAGHGSSTSKERVKDNAKKSHKDQNPRSKTGEKQAAAGVSKGDSKQPQLHSTRDVNDFIPPPPPLELKVGSEVEMTEIWKNFEQLHEYNVMLREKFLATESLLHSLASKSPTPSLENQT
ncbi:unnamed protein product [Linum tenue]|uniref:Transmembrane protein n=1 Tax=Linum tenue TaxID=586396 RepID=A0AAV0RPN5_9ROSI|nr:unnamed protein product [Linum tenue]